MGNQSSKQTKTGEAGKTHGRPRRQPREPPMEISWPIGGPIMVPPVYRDAGGRPLRHPSYDLTRETLSQALDDMAACLARSGVLANVVAVGGAVNTLYLRSRESTHDVDFFLADPHAPEHRAIHQAARHANRRLNGALGPEWFNNNTQIMMGRQVQQKVAIAAFEQNTIVYERTGNGGGLRIYAAPWPYALCGKLNRLCAAASRPYDLADAVTYLHEYLRANDRQTVSAREIYRWCQQYKKRVTDAVLHQLDEAYRHAHGHVAIDWQPPS